MLICLVDLGRCWAQVVMMIFTEYFRVDPGLQGFRARFAKATSWPN